MKRTARANQTIKLGRSLDLPIEAVTQTFALLAKRGAGKTYAALKLAEGMLESHAQIVAIDPVGKWWSLRLGADGKRAGFDIPVFGGHHGDLPLEPGAGKLIADLVVDRHVSAVLDVSLMRKGVRKQFVTDFAEQLLLRKKRDRSPSPLHLFLEESQVFVPQRTQRGEERMLGAFEDLVKLGRNYGIGATLISQRPQAVNKDVLTQTECLIVLQTIGAQERKALREWMREVGQDRAEVIDELPGLEIGEAYLWSPGWLREFRRVRIGKRKTFDASSTPKVGARGPAAAPRKLADDELEALRQTMSEVVEKAEQNDPKALRRQVAKLQAEVRRLEAVGPKTDDAALEAARAEGARAGKTLADRAIREWQQRSDAIASALSRAAADVEKARSATAEPIDLDIGALPQVDQAREVVQRLNASGAVPPVRLARARPRPATDESGDRTQLGKGERVVLIAVAQHPDGVCRNQLTVLTGYKRSTRDAYIQRLRGAGLVNVEGGWLRSTTAGIEALGDDYEPLPVGVDLQRYWLDRLPEGERRVLQAAIDAYPGSVSRQEIGNVTDYKRSTRDAYMQRLRARRLIDGDRGGVRAAGDLF